MANSYGICPKCQKCGVFGVPVKFMGTASIADGALSISDYSFLGNNTPEINEDSLICGDCKAKFSNKEVLIVETCEMCSTHYYEKDMRAYGEKRVCVNCLANLEPLPERAPAMDQLGQPSSQQPVQPTQPDITNMSQEQLIAYALQLQASINAANGVIVTAPEEDAEEQLNYTPGTPQDFPVGNYDDATEGMPVDMSLGMMPAGQLSGQSSSEQSAEVGVAASHPFRHEFQVPDRQGVVKGHIGFTGANLPADSVDKDTAAGSAGKVGAGTEIYQRGTPSDISYIATAPGACIPGVIQGVIDVSSFPFQPTHIVDVRPNGGAPI